MRIKLAALLLALWVPAAQAQDTGLSAPVKLGEATLRVLGQTIYNATLFTEGTAGFSWAQPLSLRLDYDYGFTAEQLLRGTGKELQRIEGQRADQSALLQKLAPCFQNVAPGDSYVALSPSSNRVTLRRNGKPTCDVTHPDLRKRFLGIWLSPNSRSARLSRQLRGE